MDVEETGSVPVALRYTFDSIGVKCRREDFLVSAATEDVDGSAEKLRARQTHCRQVVSPSTTGAGVVSFVTTPARAAECGR